MSTLFPESFHQFLGTLSFKPPKAETKPLVELWPDSLGAKADGTELKRKSVSIYQCEVARVSIASFRLKLLDIMQNAKHVATESVANAILGCVVHAARSGLDRAAFLENLLLHFETVDVSHFFVLPNKAITEPFRMEGYTWGAINLPVLTSRCNRAGSDFAELYSGQLAGRFTLQSPEFRHVVLNFIKVNMECDRTSGNIWKDLLLNYFSCISRLHFEFMWSHLERTQMLAAPFGAQILDVQNIRTEIGKFAQKATIYLGFSPKKVGYVLPERGALTLNQPGPESEAYKRFKDHCTTYHLSEIGDSELGRTIFAYAGFCQQAIRFLESGRSDDAALYATICLEYVFSEKQSTAEAVCSRTAVLTHLRLADNFQNSKREMGKLYNARSLFVHSGKSVNLTQSSHLIDYARETLRSMLVLHLNPKNRSTGFLKKWVKDLDFIISGFEAGRSFEDSFLADCGIFKK